MFKLVVLSALLAVAATSPIVYPAHYGYPAYPAPVVKAALPVATSYANTYRVSSPLIAPAVAPAFPAPAFAAPAFAAPAFTAPAFAAPAFPAPVAVAQPFLG